MKIEFNWGTGIFMFIVLFLMTMVGIIVFSFNQQVNLVTPEYYPKGVKFEDQITKVKNTALLKEKANISIESGKIILKFPEDFRAEKITGTAHFYYVANFEKDKKFDLIIDGDGKQEFPIEGLIPGRYILKIEWEDGKKNYYQEIDLNI